MLAYIVTASVETLSHDVCVLGRCAIECVSATRPPAMAGNAAAGRREVRRRLDGVLGRGKISNNALAEVLRAFSDEPVTQDAARKAVTRAMEERVNIMTPVGKVLQYTHVPGKHGGPDVAIEYVHPVALLIMISSVVPQFFACCRNLRAQRRGGWLRGTRMAPKRAIFCTSTIPSRCRCFIMATKRLGESASPAQTIG